VSKANLPFIDWMKCLGMLIIVYGHVAGWSAERLVPPIYAKQFGVAFFLFVLGFGLARDGRGRGHVVFNRLFEVFLFGVPFALLMSAAAYALTSRLSLSNYLPFLLGCNVAFDHFPANPTTWYIGTYIHAVLVGALVLRKVRIRPWVLLLTVLGEVLFRAAALKTGQLFVAYMALPNWASVLLLGMYYGQRAGQPRAAGPASLLGWLAALALLVAGWHALVSPRVAAGSFPFMRLAGGPEWVSLALTSAAVTFLYLSVTWLLYELTSRLPAVRGVQFFARNTLLVFIAHMPVYYLLDPALQRWTADRATRSAVLLIVCWPVLTVLSEGTCRLVRPRVLRARLGQLCGRPAVGALREA
jgi:fucose 4-O-acetylase-like acetyltransferase